MSMEFPNAPKKAGDQPSIFIPYSYGDRESAQKLAGALRRDRVSPWIEGVEMTVGDSLIHRLANTARPINLVVPIISAASVTSDWVERELTTVMSKELAGRRAIVLSVRIDDCALPAFLKGRPFVDFHTLGWNRAYENIRAAIQHRTSTAPAAHPTPAAQPPAPSPHVPDIRKKAAGTKRVFVSYDSDNDGYYKDILIAWSKQPDFAQFSVNDQPITVPVDSQDAEPLKRAIAARISAATAFLCIVGAKTCTNGWVEWEIKKADELGKRMIGVRTNRDCSVSETLCNAGATWALSFTFEGIKSAMEEAHGG
jgi:hypothetical protein